MGYLVEVVRNYLCFLSFEFDESMVSWTLADLVANVDVAQLGTTRVSSTQRSCGG